MPGHSFHVAIIGGGASGVLTAAQLHRQQPDLSVALIDSTGSGRGLAYGTPHLVHLLNVPAANMSAFPDQPEHFHYWLRQIDPWAARGTFAPRKLYGDYLSQVLEEACRAPSKVERITGTAVAVERGGEGPSRWRVTLEGGERLEANTVILALGNLPPALLSAARNLKSSRYFNDPWVPGALGVATAVVSRESSVVSAGVRRKSPAGAESSGSSKAAAVISHQSSGDSPRSSTLDPRPDSGLTADDSVLLIGTGLTAIDVVLALRSAGFQGTIHALSRRGLLPRSHAPCTPRPLPDDLPIDSALGMLQWLRAEIRRAESEGQDWRGVIDALRPRTAEIWGRWSERDRASFLRHARAYWEVHRHRAAPQIAMAIEAEIQTGTLMIHRGRIEAIEEREDGLLVSFRATGPERNNEGMSSRATHQVSSRAERGIPDLVEASSETTEPSESHIQSDRPLREGQEGSPQNQASAQPPNRLTAQPPSRPHQTLRVHRVLNCTGPDCDFTRIDQPLIVQMREAGLLVPDRLRLSIETDESGRVLDKSGAVVEGLLAVGPLRKARLWESTAMPEIRMQAEGCAREAGVFSRST